MDIRQILLSELGVDNLPDTVEIAIERVCQYVRNYCNIPEIPEALNFTIADMVLDLQQLQDSGNLTVSEVKMGDTAYTFSIDKTIKGLIKNYKTQLNAFRKLRW